MATKNTRDSALVTEQSQLLFEMAKLARAKAYAPYSNFPVGVALRTAADGIHVGCNIENTSFPEGWCAETSAIAAMVMASEGVEGRQIVELVVVADHQPPITPCGGCRQRIREFGSPGTIIHAADLEAIRQSFTLDALLPAAFNLEGEAE